MMDVTGVSANSIDNVIHIPSDFSSVAVSGKVRIRKREWSCGGQTATARSACAALGLHARYSGAFGSDEHGKGGRDELDRRGVDVRHTVDCETANANAVIVVDEAGHRTVLWHRDERLSLSPEQIPVDVLK